MYINIVGNVKNPGTYLVYDGIDFMSAISLAGGFMQGSNLKKVKVFRKNNNFEYINLDKHLAGSSSFNDFKLFPHDTIYIEQKKISEILFSLEFIRIAPAAFCILLSHISTAKSKVSSS